MLIVVVYSLLWVLHTPCHMVVAYSLCYGLLVKNSLSKPIHILIALMYKL